MKKRYSSDRPHGASCAALLFFLFLLLRFPVTGETASNPSGVAPIPRSLRPLFDPLIADGFDFPVGDRNGKGSYRGPDGRTHRGWYVAATFCERYSLGIHTGEDWNGRGGGDTDLGQPVYAVAKGRVVFAGPAQPPFGNVVIVEHRYIRNGVVAKVLSMNAHLRRVGVRVGQIVARRQAIGTIGKGTGGAYLAHLHFEIRRASMSGYPPHFWPSSNGWSVGRVRKHYESPSAFIEANRKLVVPRRSALLLVALKKEKKLFVFEGGRLVWTPPIAVSQEPVGHKQVRGDNRLPEGAYRIRQKARGPFSGTWWASYIGDAWMKLDYPNAYDAAIGLGAKRISRRQHDAIVAAIRAGRLPPQNTRLGSGIGIHGWTKGGWPADGSRALTWGCISLRNADVKRLYRRVKLGTPIFILP